ncbi:MJ1477/TM1410 family putative glycoside hydrolase [Maridesulfovibrio zosterae]|uniref:MJ1477/TM1410 family putative glycoside hydrolase n=1 Tax=Maridesulfovibrio zosterae TaxID=82171 RepID=UPI0009FF372D|nr:MJ1477/TM1410 family putative glycoside hydrolase [Maridesulfovibrio zosterae]
MKANTIIVLALLVIISACTSKASSLVDSQVDKQKIKVDFRKTSPLNKITSWAYLLQNPSVAQLAESPYDLIVTDYSKDGSDQKRITQSEISVLHKFSKTVLCYFSIGEAEEYRFYWKKEWKNNPPHFLGIENPDWAANYKVKYWREDWWEICLQPYLDSILEAGFDGVYLDIVDAYWFWHEQGMEVQNTADDMVKLIKRIADYCRKSAGKNFIICPQNGLGVFESCSPEYKDIYFKTINMVGLESLLFNIHSESDRDYRLTLCKKLTDAGKIVLDVEYIDKIKYVDYLDKIEKLNFPLIPYASAPDAALNKLTDFYKYRK